MIDAKIGNPYGSPGSFEGINIVGKKNIAINFTVGNVTMDYQISQRSLFGIIENKITDIYSAEIYFDYSLEKENRETRISFVESSDAFYKLKEVYYSHGKVIKTKILPFNTKTKKYL
jgi:hypothetical protein